MNPRSAPFPACRGSASRRGAAMPWVLMGMGLAALVGVLAWSRAWTHRERANLQAAQWQAQLLAETALACAEDSVWAMVNGGGGGAAKSSDSGFTKLDSSLARGVDSAASSCPLPPGMRGTLDYSIEAGSLLVPVHASGEMSFGSRTIRRSIRAMLSGALDRDLFDVAVSQWVEAKPAVLDISGTRIVGKIRVRTSGTPPSGMEAQPKALLGITAYVPNRSAQDTAILENRMKEALRSSDAYSGGAAYSAGRSFPDREEIVHAGGGEGREVQVEIEGPLGAPGWTPPSKRTLVVEGDVFVRGRVMLDGWTILAKGRIVLEGNAKLRESVLYAAKGVFLQGEAVFQGQILSFRTFEVHEQARLTGPSAVLCWAKDSGKVVFDGSATSNGYLVVLGGAASLKIGRDATFEGVAVSGGSMQVAGRIHGVAVAGSFRCGRGTESCTGSGVFDRSRLPADFAVPVGLPGAQGLRVATWELEE